MPPRTPNQLVQGGLGLRGGLTAAQLTYLEFEPTIGITTARINKLANLVMDFKQPLQEAIRKVIIPSIQKNFAVGGRPPWPPWSSETLEFKAMLGESMGPSLLVRSGALRTTMASPSIWTVTRDFAILKDIPGNVWYGKVHQAGYGGMASRKGNLQQIVADAVTGKGPGHAAPIPARPFVMFQSEDEDDIMELFVEWLGDQVNKAWPKGV